MWSLQENSFESGKLQSYRLKLTIRNDALEKIP